MMLIAVAAYAVAAGDVVLGFDGVPPVAFANARARRRPASYVK